MQITLSKQPTIRKRKKKNLLPDTIVMTMLNAVVLRRRTMMTMMTDCGI